MNIEKLAEMYLRDSVLNKKHGSYKYDKSHLNTICNYLLSKNITNTSDITFEHLYDFVDISKVRNNTNKTINKRIEILKRAIAHSVKLRLCEPSIIVAFPKLKEVKKRFNVVQVETMRKVLDYLLSLDDSYMNLRNKVIIFIFIDTGIRLSELTNILISNVDLYNNTILLTETKNSIHRVVHFTDFTKSYLNRFIKLLDDSHDYLFRNTRNNNPITYLGVIRVTQKIKNELNLKEFSSHMIRHSYGTLAYELEVSEVFTMRMLGHEDLKTTKIYQHYNVRKDRELYSKLSPMNYYLYNKKDLS